MFGISNALYGGGTCGGAPRQSTMEKACLKPNQVRNNKTGRCHVPPVTKGTTSNKRRRRSSSSTDDDEVQLLGPTGTHIKLRRTSPSNPYGPTGTHRKARHVKRQLFSPQRSSRSSRSSRRSSGSIGVGALNEQTTQLFERVERLEREAAASSENNSDEFAQMNKRIDALDRHLSALDRSA